MYLANKYFVQDIILIQTIVFNELSDVLDTILNSKHQNGILELLDLDTHLKKCLKMFFHFDTSFSTPTDLCILRVNESETITSPLSKF